MNIARRKKKIAIKSEQRFRRNPRLCWEYFFPFISPPLVDYKAPLPDPGTYFPRHQKHWLQKVPISWPPFWELPWEEGSCLLWGHLTVTSLYLSHAVSSEVTSLQGTGLRGGTKMCHLSLIRKQLKEPFQCQSFLEDWLRTLVGHQENPSILWPILIPSLV